MSRPTRVLHIGKSSRLHLMAETMLRSRHLVENFLISEVSNPGLARVAAAPVHVGQSDSWDVVGAYAREIKPDIAIIGPEEPLEAGIVDRLEELGIRTVGPVRDLAMIETSKTFARELLREFQIDGNPDYRVFEDDRGVEDYLARLGEFVVKPDGLTGGKGVKVFGEHLHSIEEGLAYCRAILDGGGRVIIEEKVEGEEFTLQAFSDGNTVLNMVPVQDHKRLKDGDRGPNTGGMGSYSGENHILPFLRREDVLSAGEINRNVIAALLKKKGQAYKGIIYGSFMATAAGIKVIEFNARFGDPEAMNVLSLLETDFMDICLAITEGTLDQIDLAFSRKASVCKYVVPDTYPHPLVGEKAIHLPQLDNSSPSLKMYYGAVEGECDDDLVMTGSRAVAFVGIGETLQDAEQAAEQGAASVEGRVFHRKDIGTSGLVAKRVAHMRELSHGADDPVRRLA